MPETDNVSSTQEAPERKPRPKAKTRENKAKERAAKSVESVHGMRSVVKKSARKSAGKPSVLGHEDDEQEAATSYGLLGGLTLPLMVQLAAPHTWAASVMPVLLAICMAAADSGTVSSLMAIVLLLISISMQSAVNAFNDYVDFQSGADTRENQPDPTDAVLVYNDVKPYGVRNLAIGFMGFAFLLGIYVIVKAGWIPLVIALIGAAVAFLYSGGPKPLSFLPLGECVSGFVMGGLIALASYTALAGIFSWKALIMGIPMMVGIALIMFTNNTCDIEKDRKVGRSTLPVTLGRKDSVFLYRIFIAVWLILIALLIVIYYPTGSIILFFLIAAYPPLMGLMRNPFIPPTREAGMAAITSSNAILGLVYCAAILMSGVVVIVA